MWTAAASGGNEKDCRTNPSPTGSGWLDAAACSQLSQVEGANDCRINAGPVGVDSALCNSQTRTGSAGSYAYTGGASANYCETVVTSPFATVNYAWAPAASTDSSGFTTQCQFVGSVLNPTPTWADYTAGGACTPDAITDCRTVDVTGWVASDICNTATPDGTGKSTQCRDTATNGSKLQSLAKSQSKVYSGPGRTGTLLTTHPEETLGLWTDAPKGACYASAPAVPALATVPGRAPPTPHANTSSRPPAWPCET